MSDDQILKKFFRLHPRIRSRFPQIEKDDQGNRRIHLNCGAGTLTVDTAAQAMAATALGMNPLPGEVTPAEIATKEFHGHVRQVAADFLGAADPAEISFHFSATQALFNFAFSLHDIIGPQNNIVVTDLDHMANITPWESLAEKLGACPVRRARITEQGRLDADSLLSIVDENTAVVALTLASNGIGTIVPVEELVPGIKEKAPSCLICVDAVHHALHGTIDVQKMDCDALVFSGYKLFGPMLGVLWGKKSLLSRATPYRVETNKNEIPFKYEMGTLPNASLAALQAALEYLLWLADALEPQPAGERQDCRAKFRRAMQAVSAYDQEVSRLVLQGMEKLDGGKFRCHGLTEPRLAGQRDPTFAFEVAGRGARETKQLLWQRHSIQIADGNHYSAVFFRHLGIASICRASFAHYSSLEEAETFVQALEELIKA